MVGGFLAQPARKYAAFQVPFFCKFPFILPCLVAVGYSVFVLIGECKNACLTVVWLCYAAERR